MVSLILVSQYFRNSGYRNRQFSFKIIIFFKYCMYTPKLPFLHNLNNLCKWQIHLIIYSSFKYVGLDYIEFKKICIFKVLNANDPNLWYTSFLWLLKDAELKSAVWPAIQWLIMPQIEKSKMRVITELKCIYVHIILTMQDINFNKMCSCRFSYLGIQCHNRFWEKLIET